MFGAMYSGISGMEAYQTQLDVIGNNISNVDTTGFKAGLVTFQDQLSQTLRNGNGPSGLMGGVNPMQVGTGVSPGSISTLQTQGNLQSTGNPTDMALQGNGFFMVSDGTNVSYTRDGSFSLDNQGNLVNVNGQHVMGYTADSSGNIDTTQSLSPSNEIQIPVGTLTTEKATQNATMQGNLDPTDPSGAWTTSLTAYDSLGIAHNISYKFTKTTVDANAPTGATGEWSWTASEGANQVGSSATSGSSPLYFSAQGALMNTTPLALNLTPTGADPISAKVDVSGVTQLASASSVTTASQDGYPVGTLQTFSVDASGVISGVFTNGQTQKLGQVAVASFTNPAGLTKQGQNLYTVSAASGTPQVGAAGRNGRGSISAGYTEMSNVDLSSELTNMIVTQRSFDANTKIISTSDDILQEIINLKR